MNLGGGIVSGGGPVDTRGGPGVMLGHWGPSMATAHPEQVPQGSGELTNKVAEQRGGVPLLPGVKEGRNPQR